MKKVICRWGIMVILISLVFCPCGAFGQEKEFPINPVNIYVGYPPGGGVAIPAQILAEEMKKYLNQAVVVNFKPGASQAIAADFVSKSKPDGYNLLYMNDLDLILKLIQEGSAIKFTMKDFVPLGFMPSHIYTLVVRAESPWKSLTDFVEYGRKSPAGTLTIGGAGLATTPHMLFEIFSRKTGVPLTYIPFQGGGPADTALLGGHISASVGSIGRYVERLKPGGGLRALGVFDKTRHPNYPDVPTFIEKGYDVSVSVGNGLYAPKGVSIRVKTILCQAFERSAKDPKIVSMLSKEGYGVVYLNPEEMQKQNEANYLLFKDLLTKIGVLKK